jgi:hypothetical protein
VQIQRLLGTQGGGVDVPSLAAALSIPTSGPAVVVGLAADGLSAEALAGLSAVEAAEGKALRAARIAAAAEALRASEGARPLPFELAITGPLLEKARRGELDAAWEAASEEGAELGLDRAVAFAVGA